MNERECRASPRTQRKGTVVLMIVILVLAVALRVALALYNRQANDDHLSVIAIIAHRGFIPAARDCPLCYHPKLYYLLCAGLNNLFGIRSRPTAIVTFQMVNVASGMVVILVTGLFLRHLRLPSALSLIGFALVALNPKLIGINAQATNDSFVIMFGALAVYGVWRYLQKATLIRGAAVVVFPILAALTKGSGLVLAGATVVVLTARLLTTWRDSRARSRHLLLIVVFLAVFLATVPYLGQYYSNYRFFGSPFGLNTPRSRPPKLFEPTKDIYPLGVTTIVGTYFTFRPICLLKYPYITNDRDIFPRHRTSLWSQIFGRANFVHFDQWPPSWQNRSALILTVGRAILFLAFLPLILMLWGMAIHCKALAVGIWRRGGAYFAENSDWIFSLFAVCFVAMLINLTCTYRAFFTMKAIYLYPVGLGFLKFFLDGCAACYARIVRSRVLTYAFYGWFSTLLALYCFDVGVLIVQLYQRHPGL